MCRHENMHHMFNANNVSNVCSDLITFLQLLKYCTCKVNKNQRGFLNTPGCQINTAIISGILHKADKAFEESSHNHIECSFNHMEIPTALRNLMTNLLRGNETQILTAHGLSKSIQVKKGVFQGLPKKYGYQIHPDVENFTNAGFADDLTILRSCCCIRNYR